MSAAMTDAELVASAQAGSDAAFSRLVERHQAALRGFLRPLLGSGWAEADDLAQEAFLVAWRRLSELKRPDGFRSWLMGIGWRQALARIRSHRRGAARDLAWLEGRGLAGRGLEGRELPGGVDREEALALDQALKGLSERERACVILCLAQDWSHAEAAEALKLPLGTVKSHVTRGRARLLSVLGVQDDAG